MQIALISGIAIGIVAVLFALQNTTEITVKLAAWSFEGSLALVLLSTLGLGALIAGLLSSPTVIRSQWNVLRLGRRLAELERKLDAHQQRNAELEAELAAARSVGESDPSAVAIADKPYVGLRALMASAPADTPPT